MARIRTIKPSFWGAVGGLSRDARLLAVGLISMADDAGRFIATPSAILGYVYPMDSNVSPAQLRKWLAENAAHRGKDGTPFIVLYEADGCHYGYFPRYRKHQKINRPQPSSLPQPPQDALFEAV